MTKSSQAMRVVDFLKTKPNQEFTDKQIAEAILKIHPHEYLEKGQNSRFETEQQFVAQIAKEISSQKDQIANMFFVKVNLNHESIGITQNKFGKGKNLKPILSIPRLKIIQNPPLINLSLNKK